MVTFMLGLKPGHARSDFLKMGTAPDADEIAGRPVHLELAAVRLTYVAAGQEASLPPVVVRAIHRIVARRC